MAPTDSNGNIGIGGQQVQTFLFFGVWFSRNGLQNQVRSVWLINSHHLYLFSQILHYIRKGSLTNFTLEFCEIIRTHNSMKFFLDLTINPFLQTSYMEVTAASLASTWRNQRIIFLVFIAQTDLALLWLGRLFFFNSSRSFFFLLHIFSFHIFLFFQILVVLVFFRLNFFLFNFIFLFNLFFLV